MVRESVSLDSTPREAPLETLEHLETARNHNRDDPAPSLIEPTRMEVKAPS